MRCFHSFDDLKFYVLDLPNADSLKKNLQICVGKIENGFKIWKY